MFDLYAVDADRLIYVTDAVYSRAPMEETEPLVGGSARAVGGVRQALIESNNGGRGFARAVQSLARDVRVEWFHQSGNKEARILSECRHGPASGALAAGLEPPLARSLRPSDDLSAAVPGRIAGTMRRMS